MPPLPTCADRPGIGAHLLTQICFSSSLLSSIMLNVLFVYVVLALYLMCSRIFYSSLALDEGKLPAKLRIIICRHQSSVYTVGASWDRLDFKHKTELLLFGAISFCVPGVCRDVWTRECWPARGGGRHTTAAFSGRPFLGPPELSCWSSGKSVVA